MINPCFIRPWCRLCLLSSAIFWSVLAQPANVGNGRLHSFKELAVPLDPGVDQPGRRVAPRVANPGLDQEIDRLEVAWPDPAGDHVSLHRRLKDSVYLGPGFLEIDLELSQNAGSNAFPFPDETKQDVLGSNVCGTESVCLFLGPDDGALASKPNGCHTTRGWRKGSDFLYQKALGAIFRIGVAAAIP